MIDIVSNDDEDVMIEAARELTAVLMTSMVMLAE